MSRRPYGILRVDRAFIGLISQRTALTNAAEASAILWQRQLEREDVDAYLGGLDSLSVADRR